MNCAVKQLNKRLLFVLLLPAKFLYLFYILMPFVLVFTPLKNQCLQGLTGGSKFVLTS